MTALSTSAKYTLERVRAHAERIAQIIDVTTLETPEQERTAGDLLRLIKTIEADAEAERKTAKAPHLAASRAVDDAFRAPLAELARVEGLLRARLSEAIERREAERRAAQAALVAAAKAGDAEGANRAALAVATAPAAPEGISERWTYEVASVDLGRVPPGYLMLDLPAVRAFVSAEVKAGREPAIPGLEFRRVAAVRVAKL